MGRRPTIQYRAQCGPSSLLLRVSVARCPKALAPRMSPCRVFQIRLRFRGIQKSSSRPRRRPAEGLRKLAEVNRRRSGRRKPAEARLRPAENKLVSKIGRCWQPCRAQDCRACQIRTVCTNRQYVRCFIFLDTWAPGGLRALPRTGVQGPEMNPQTPQDSPDPATRGPQGKSIWPTPLNTLTTSV